MSPKKPVTGLNEICLDVVTKRIQKFIEKKIEKINFFNDYDAAARDFLLRCRDGRDFIDEYFIGPLRLYLLVNLTRILMMILDGRFWITFCR